MWSQIESKIPIEFLDKLFYIHVLAYLLFNCRQPDLKNQKTSRRSLSHGGLYPKLASRKTTIEMTKAMYRGQYEHKDEEVQFLDMEVATWHELHIFIGKPYLMPFDVNVIEYL